jgi:hypothetical protein
MTHEQEEMMDPATRQPEITVSVIADQRMVR